MTVKHLAEVLLDYKDAVSLFCVWFPAPIITNHLRDYSPTYLADIQTVLVGHNVFSWNTSFNTAYTDREVCKENK